MKRARLLLLGLPLALLLLSPAGASPARRLPPVRHVFIIVLENKGFDKTFGYRSPAPYLAWKLPSLGALIPNYYGVTHQSNPNYIAMVSGQGANPDSQADCQLYHDMVTVHLTPGQTREIGCVFPTGVKTVADQLASSHLTWRGYMEDMGNAAGQLHTCRHPPMNSKDNTQTAHKGDEYAGRHNPFIYFHSLLDSGACTKYDVPLTRLSGDLKSAATTPNYSFITPNLCNDGHDSPCVDGRPGGLRSADAFLRRWVPRILASPAYKRSGLLVVTFDESDGSDSSACCGEPKFPNTPNNGGEYPGPGGGHVGAVVLSPFIDPGTVDEVAYNHFSLLRSVEDLFGLGHLGYAAQSGLRPFGSDLFTCYAPGRPHASGGRLPYGSEIKLAVIGQGTAPRPSVEVKLWHPGTVRVQVRSVYSPTTRTISRTQVPAACQLLKVGLPFSHGTAVVSASAFGGVERRTLSF